MNLIKGILTLGACDEIRFMSRKSILLIQTKHARNGMPASSTLKSHLQVLWTTRSQSNQLQQVSASLPLESKDALRVAIMCLWIS